MTKTVISQRYCFKSLHTNFDDTPIFKAQLLLDFFLLFSIAVLSSDWDSWQNSFHFNKNRWHFYYVDDMKMSQFSPLLEECVQFSRIRKICLNPWLKLLTKTLCFSPPLSLYIERPVNTISNVFRWKKQQNRWKRRIEEFRQNKIN